MKNTASDDINRYLRDEMPPDERQQFEARLPHEPALQRQLRDTQLMAEGLRRAGRSDLRQRIDAAGDRYRRGARIRRLRPFFAAAAMAAALAGWFLLGPLLFKKEDSGGATQPVASEEKNTPADQPPAGGPANPNGLLGSTEKPLFDGELAIVDGAGRPTGERTRVVVFPEKTGGPPVSLTADGALRVYIPPAMGLELPPVVARRDGGLFLKTPEGWRWLNTSAEAAPF